MDLKHRLTKIQLKNGHWVKLWNVKNINKILKYDYKNVYISVSKWLNPKNVEKPTYNHYILDSEIFIDFDDNLNDVLKVKSYMKKYKEYKLSQIVRTSENGLHLIYSLKKIPLLPPKERLEFFIKEKKRIADDLKQQGFQIDYPILLDIYRIRRLPLTFNGNKGRFLCCDIQSLEIGHLKPKMTTKSAPKYLDGKATKSKLPIFYKYVTNQVYGLKDRYVVYIKVKDKSQLKDVCEKYNIRHYTILSDSKFITLISPKIIDYRRLCKILKYCNSMNYNSFAKYKNSWIRTSSIINVDGKEINKKPEIIEKKESNENGHFSQYHSKLFNFSINNNLIGKDNKVYIAKVGY